jgi:hypothetical protein
MASQDSAIIGWIQYHWGQLRLARSTLVPSFLLVLFLPWAATDWPGCSVTTILGLALLAFLFFLIQLGHYYYRERFMIYAMLGYFLVK